MQRMKARLERGYWVIRTVAPGYTYINDPIHKRHLVKVEPEASILKQALEGFASGRFPNLIDVLNFFKQRPL